MQQIKLQRLQDFEVALKRTNPKAIDPNSIRYSADGTVIEIETWQVIKLKGGVKVGSELEKQLIDSGLLRLEVD